MSWWFALQCDYYLLLSERKYFFDNAEKLRWIVVAIQIRRTRKQTEKKVFKQVMLA